MGAGDCRRRCSLWIKDQELQGTNHLPLRVARVLLPEASLGQALGKDKPPRPRVLGATPPKKRRGIWAGGILQAITLKARELSISPPFSRACPSPSTRGRKEYSGFTGREVVGHFFRFSCFLINLMASYKKSSKSPADPEPSSG